MYSLSEASTLQRTEQNFVLSSSVFRSTIASLRSAINKISLAISAGFFLQKGFFFRKNESFFPFIILSSAHTFGNQEGLSICCLNDEINNI